ncbi:NYN domain-containing protein [Nocardioides sp. LML1-1-1.1]|uniref:NYN domain-containing protein n=1 Tax=Nocardioides sp. LML1-1-1.1 TaxID=3135248 RepID=UPI00344712A9
MTDRLAVLIDADNTSHRYVGDLLAELAKYGRPTVKRAYGDWTADGLRGWKAKLNRHAISPEQTFAYTVGKNSTDSALIIDAMDLLYSGNVDAFAIVSSDSDFTRLATRLRESGRTVYAVGRSNTPIALQEACDRFIRLELLDQSPDDTAGAEDERTAEPATLPNLQSLLTRAVNNASDDDGWVGLPTLGTYLRTAYPAFDPRAYGFAKLIDLVQAQGFLSTEGAGNSLRVSVKGRASTKNAAAKKVAPKKKAAPKK